MLRFPSLLVLAVAALFALFSPSADAQFRIRIGSQHNDHHDDHHDDDHHGGHNNGHNNNHVPPGFHVDHHNHPVRDSHGHVIGNVHHDVIHRDARYVIPYVQNTVHRGTYHLHGGNYYYTPRAVVGRARVVQKPAVVSFGGFSHVDDLAVRLETLANEFCLDLHYNYQHNHGFQETYGEAYQILQVAKFIHAAEHQQDRDAIRSKLGGLDRLMHHVEGDVRGWSRHHHRQIGQLGIVSKMEMIESTLHHLMNDVGVHPTAAGEQAPVPGGGGVERAPTPAIAPTPAPAGR